MTDRPFALFSLLFLTLHFKLSFLIFPQLLLLSELLLDGFPQISFLFSFLLSIFSLLLPLCLQLLDRLEVIFLEHGHVLMQFFDLIIFEVVGGSQFADLLV